MIVPPSRQAFLLVALCAVLCSANSSLTIDASTEAGTAVAAPPGAYTTLTVTKITGKRVVIPPGVTAGSLVFSGTIKNSDLVIQGGTFQGITVGSMVQGSVSFANATVNGAVTFSSLVNLSGVDVGGLTVEGGPVTFAAIDGQSSRPAVSLAGLTVSASSGTGGVLFGSSVKALSRLSFDNASIQVGSSGNTFAVRFEDTVESVDELSFDGSRLVAVTTSASGSAGSIFGDSKFSDVRRVSIASAQLQSTAPKRSYSLYLSGALENTFVSVSDSTISASATTAGSSTAHAALFGPFSGHRSGLEFVDSTVTAKADRGAVFALKSGGVTGGSVSVNGTRVTATSKTGAASAGIFGPITDAPFVRWVRSPATATAHGGAPSAVNIGVLTNVTEVLIDGGAIKAEVDTNHIAWALRFSSVTDVTALTIQHVVVTATSVQEAGSRAAVFAGSTSYIGAILFKNVTAVATADVYAWALSFVHAVSNVGSLVFDGVDVAGHTKGRTSTTGYAARAVMFGGSVDTIRTLSIRRATITTTAARALKSVTAEYGARSLYFSDHVRHITALSIDDVSATATCAGSFASAVHFKLTVRNVSSFLVVRTVASATAGDSTSHALSIEGGLFQSGSVVVRSVNATTDTHNGISFVMKMGEWSDVASLFIEGSNLKATGNSADVQVLSFTSSITGVRFLNVTGSTLDADSSTGGTASNAYAFMVEDKVTDVEAVDVMRSTVRATAKSNRARAVVLLNGLFRSTRVLLQDSTVEARSTASSDANAVFIGKTSAVESIEIIDTSVTATTKTDTARALYVVSLTNVMRLAVLRATLTAHAGDDMATAASILSMTHGSSLTVQHCTLTASSGGFGATAMYANDVTDVATLTVMNVSVSATAATYTAYAFYTGALVGVQAMELRALRLNAIAGTHRPYALHIASISNATSVLVDGVNAVARTDGGTTASAVVLGATAFSHVSDLRVQHVFASATCRFQNTARAVTLPGAQHCGALLFRNVSCVATSRTYAWALMVTGTISHVRSVVYDDVTATAETVGTTSNQGQGARALGFFDNIDFVDTIHVRGAVVKSTSKRSYTASSTQYGARALHFRRSVQHVGSVSIEDVSATATSGQDYASAVHFADVLLNVSSVVVARTSAAASAMSGEYAYGVAFTERVQNCGPISVRSVNATSYSTDGQTGVLQVGKIVNVKSLLVENSRLRATARAGSHVRALSVESSVAELGFLNVTDSTLFAVSTGSPGSNVYALAIADTTKDVGAVIVVGSTLQATAWTSVARALTFAGGLERVGRIAVQQSVVEATAQTASTAEALSFVTITDVATFEVIDTNVSAVADTAFSTALSTGALVDVKTVAVVRCSAVAESGGRDAVALYFASMTRGDWFAIQDTHASATASTHTAYALYLGTMTHGARLSIIRSVVTAVASTSRAYALTTGALNNISHIQISRTTASSSCQDATSFSVRLGSVMSAAVLLVDGVRAVAKATQGKAVDALVVATVSHVSNMTLRNLFASALGTKENAQALVIPTLQSIGAASYENVTATATAGTFALALSFVSVNNAGSLVIDGASVSAHTTSHLGSEGYDARALAFYNALEVVGEFVIRNATATAMSRTSASSGSTQHGAHAVWFRQQVRHVTSITLDGLTLTATSQSHFANAGLIEGQMTNVSNFTVRNVVAEATASATNARVLSIEGTVTHCGPFVYQDVNATATSHTWLAGVLRMSTWQNVSSLLVQRSHLRATAAGAVGALTFSSSLVELGFLNVTDSTLVVGHFSGPASNAYALTVEGTVTDVGAVSITWSAVAATARSTAARAVAFNAAMLRVQHVLVRDCTVEATTKVGSNAHALHFSAITDTQSIEVVDSTVSAQSNEGNALALTTRALLDVRSVRITHVHATAEAGTSTVYALSLAALTRVTFVTIQDVSATVTAGTHTAYALEIGSTQHADRLTIVGVRATATCVVRSSQAVVLSTIKDTKEVVIEHVRAIAESKQEGSTYALYLGTLVRVSAISVQHVFLKAESKGTDAHALFSPGVTAVGTLHYHNVTAHATSAASAWALSFGAAMSDVGAIVIDSADVSSSTTGTSAGSGYGARSVSFHASVQRVGAITVRNATIVATAAQTSGATGAHAVWFRETVRHVSTIEIRDSTVTTTCQQRYASAVHFLQAVLNVSQVSVSGASITAKSSSQPSALIASDSITSVALTIERCTVIADSAAVALMSTPTIEDSSVSIDSSFFELVSTVAAANKFIEVATLRRSSYSVKRTVVKTLGTHVAQFVKIAAVDNSSIAFAAVTATPKVKFGSGTYPPMELGAPTNPSEVCINRVRIGWPNETGSYEYNPAPALTDLGFTVADPSRCRATETAELTVTVALLPTATETASKSWTVSQTFSKSTTESVRPSSSLSPPPSTSRSAPATRTDTHAATVTAATRSATTSALVTSSPSSTLPLPETPPRSSSTSRTATLDRTATVSASSTATMTSAPIPTPSVVSASATLKATATAAPTKTVVLEPAPRSVPASLEGARTAARVTASVSAVVSPTAALAQQRAGALTGGSCPTAAPNGDEPLSVTDNPLRLSIGSSPARHHVGALLGNLLLITIGCLICAVAAVAVSILTAALPKHKYRVTARRAGVVPYAVCLFLQCFGGEVAMILALLVVTPSCTAAVVCIGHPSEEVEGGIRVAGVVALAVAIAVSTCLSALSIGLARRFCYCPDESAEQQASSAVVADREAGAPPPPWEALKTGEDSVGDVDELSGGPRMSSPLKTDSSIHGDDEPMNPTPAHAIAARRRVGGAYDTARRFAKAAIIGPEWEARPELRPLQSGAAEVVLLLIGDTRPGIARPHLFFFDRYGCHWFFALDLWVSILTGIGVGALELSQCDVAGAVAALQLLHVLVFIVARPLRSPLLLGVTLIALLLQSAAVITAAATSSGVFSDGSPADGDTIGEENGATGGSAADVLDSLSTTLALVLALQGLIGFAIGLLTQWRRRQRAQQRSLDTEERQAADHDVLMAPLLTTTHDPGPEPDDPPCFARSVSADLDHALGDLLRGGASGSTLPCESASAEVLPAEPQHGSGGAHDGGDPSVEGSVDALLGLESRFADHTDEHPNPEGHNLVDDPFDEDFNPDGAPEIDDLSFPSPADQSAPHEGRGLSLGDPMVLSHPISEHLLDPLDFFAESSTESDGFDCEPSSGVRDESGDADRQRSPLTLDEMLDVSDAVRTDGIRSVGSSRFGLPRAEAAAGAAVSDAAATGAVNPLAARGFRRAPVGVQSEATSDNQPTDAPNRRTRQRKKAPGTRRRKEVVAQVPLENWKVAVDLL